MTEAIEEHQVATVAKTNGNGESGGKNLSVLKKKHKLKPARVQVDPDSINDDSKPPQTGTVFNIWYAKWSGGDSNNNHQQVHSRTRCNIKLDSGYTKADKHRLKEPIFCLYFARGSCCMGKNCEYLHRLPTDDDLVSQTHDCFGREKFSDYRDDMGGIGNFNRINRTLYIGRINNMSDPNVELKISENFKQFGDIEKIRVIHEKNIAFVRYKNELNAQFAKEAMAHQSLDRGNEKECLNVRWANEDPDPEAQRREKRKREEDALNTVKRLLAKIEEDDEKLAAKRNKRNNTVIIEEPEEIEKNEVRETKLLKESSEKSSLFTHSSLDILKKMNVGRKNINNVSDNNDKKIKNLVSGYGSDSEEE